MALHSAISGNAKCRSLQAGARTKRKKLDFAVNHNRPLPRLAVAIFDFRKLNPYAPQPPRSPGSTTGSRLSRATSLRTIAPSVQPSTNPRYRSCLELDPEPATRLDHRTKPVNYRLDAADVEFLRTVFYQDVVEFQRLTDLRVSDWPTVNPNITIAA